MSFFKGEFFSTHLDDDYMRSNGPDKIINYKSAIREDFKEIMKITKPVVFCCASGGRSGQATSYFKSKGLNCENGGGWMTVNGMV